MGGLFRFDGPVYKFCNYVYYVFYGNILWLLCCLPLVTAGASTTALYYVMGKVSRGEDVSMTKDFFKSFKLNFKQATITWLILVPTFMIVIVSRRNVQVYGSMSKFMFYVETIVLIELIMTTLYIFPVLSRVEISIKDLFKTSNFLANRHFLTTVFCGSVFIFLVEVAFGGMRLGYISTFAFFTLMGAYALYASYMIGRKLKKYLPEEKKEEIVEKPLNIKLLEEEEENENLTVR